MAVLNRLYIAVGILAILVLLAGFFLPPMVDWSGYRDRLETLAESNLGTDVTIDGEIDFRLLPRPQIRLGKTILGPPSSPLVEIEAIIADLSLLDLLRDRLNVTNLDLRSPLININIGISGEFEIPLSLSENFNNGRVLISAIKISDANLRINDARNSQSIQIEEFNGDLNISGINGPFRLQGSALVGGEKNNLRISLSSINAQNEAQASLFMRADDASYTIAAEGLLQLGPRAKFIGEGSVRISNSAQGENQQVRGDSVLSAEVELSGEKLLLTSFELQADENRIGSRLNGAAVINLGELQNFDIVVSGNVVKLAPVDIRHENDGAPYELLDFINNFPRIYTPQIPGRLGMDIGELSIGNLAMRNVRIDALSDGGNWELAGFGATLPGNSEFSLSGVVSKSNEGGSFDGKTSVISSSVGALAQLWNGAIVSNQLFGKPAEISSELRFANGTLTLTNGKLEMDGVAHEFAGLFELSGQRTALLSARIAPVDASQSDNLISLLPQISGGGAFLNSFPSGGVDISLERAVLFNLDTSMATLQMDWDEAGIRIGRLVADNIGGAQIEFFGNLSSNSGNEQLRALWGEGKIFLGQKARDQFLPVMLNYFGAEPVLQGWAAQSLPLEVYINLDESGNNGDQRFWAEGNAAASDFELEANLSEGIFAALNAPMEMVINLSSSEGDLLSAQLGAKGVALFPAGEQINILAGIKGVIAEQIDADLRLSYGAESIEYSGQIDFRNVNNIKADGRVTFTLADFSPFNELVGAGGIYLPRAGGEADVFYGPNGEIRFENLQVLGELGEVNPLDGNFEISTKNGARSIQGQVKIATIDVEQLLTTIGGPAVLVAGEGFWPEGPINVGTNPDPVSGNIFINAQQVIGGGKILISDASFNLMWDENSIAIENLQGKNGEGDIVGSFRLCCTLSGAQKQLSGRLALEGVEISGLGLERISQNIAGIFDGGVFFESSGVSIAELARNFSGQGSFAVSNLIIDRLNPQVFEELGSVENALNMDEQKFSLLVGNILDQGNFEAQNIGGTFLVAGGILRASNIAVSGDSGALLGEIELGLSDISLDTDWVFLPVAVPDEASGATIASGPSGGGINVNTRGTLLEPFRELDLLGMIDAFQVQAMEAELERLEQLRTEQEERSRQAALERARRMELDSLRLEKKNLEQQDLEQQEGAVVHGQDGEDQELGPLQLGLENPDSQLFLFEPQNF
ncbi:MAG: AsmA family protein [Devosiaceae bacterium]|nr:AsmA family protein [Devosiaceae bacterium]